NVGSTVVHQDAVALKPGTITDLRDALNGNAVDTLVVLGGNPVYDAPADLQWAATQRKAKTVVRWGYYEDETAAVSDYHLASAHYLESWGDARTADGTVVPVQPLIAPLFGGLTELEVLARLGGLGSTNPYDIVRETFQTLAPGADFEERWKRFLHDGFLGGSAAKPATAQFDFAAAAKAVNLTPSPAPTKDAL